MPIPPAHFPKHKTSEVQLCISERNLKETVTAVSVMAEKKEARNRGKPVLTFFSGSYRQTVQQVTG